VAFRGAVTAYFCLLSLVCAGAPAGAAGEHPRATCTIAFRGTSSLHDFQGTIPSVETPLDPASSAGRWNADVHVPVAGMETGNAGRDARMREMMGAKKSPEILVVLRDVDPAAVREQRRLAGDLTIAGKTHGFVADVSNWQDEPGGASFDVTGNVSLEGYGLEAPSVLGLVRVDDKVEVTVHVDVDTTPRDATVQNAAPRKDTN